jgi:aspartyl-tRNA(Asn)/glutamyl-tRNA(Gln) amidotransferase subunit A
MGGTNVNYFFPTPKNPWDQTRITGGSSGGSGLALAAGFCYGSLGTDTRGSIRMPASVCGITGLKPTYGRVSRAGVLPLAWSMDHVGPMTRTAADCALMLGAMAGYDPNDASSSVLPVPDYVAALTGEVKGLRVGLLRSFFLDGAAPAVRAAVEAAAATLGSAGAVVDEVRLERVTLVPAASTAIVGSEALAYHAQMLRTRAADYDPDIARRLRLSAFIGGAHYVRAQQVRALVRDEIDAALARRDVLLAPSTPIVAPAVGERQVELGDGGADVRSALIRFTRPFNLSGHPACAVPCGFTDGGLPIGMQLVGRPFDEVTVLRAADAFQRLTDFHLRRPVLA